MRTLVFLFCFLPIAVLGAESNYIFEVDMSAPRVSLADSGPVMTNGMSRITTDGRYRIFVTEAEYAAGLGALSQARIDAELAKANKTVSDADNWEPKLRKLGKLAWKEFNKLRKKVGLTEYTWEQFKEALENE